MLALFIGQAYIDVTMLANSVPTGDDKAVATDYAISFGGNAVTAAFASAKLDKCQTCWPASPTTGLDACFPIWRSNIAFLCMAGR